MLALLWRRIEPLLPERVTLTLSTASRDACIPSHPFSSVGFGVGYQNTRICWQARQRLPEGEALALLRRRSEPLLRAYLEHMVLERGNANPAHHTELALALVAAALRLMQPSDAGCGPCPCKGSQSDYFARSSRSQQSPSRCASHHRPTWGATPALQGCPDQSHVWLKDYPASSAKAKAAKKSCAWLRKHKQSLQCISCLYLCDAMKPSAHTAVCDTWGTLCRAARRPDSSRRQDAQCGECLGLGRVKPYALTP